MPGAKSEASPPPEPLGPPPGHRSSPGSSPGSNGLHGRAQPDGDGDGVLAFAAGGEAAAVEVHYLEGTLTLTPTLTPT